MKGDNSKSSSNSNLNGSPQTSNIIQTQTHSKVPNLNAEEVAELTGAMPNIEEVNASKEFDTSLNNTININDISNIEHNKSSYDPQSNADLINMFNERPKANLLKDRPKEALEKHKNRIRPHTEKSSSSKSHQEQPKAKAQAKVVNIQKNIQTIENPEEHTSTQKPLNSLQTEFRASKTTANAQAYATLLNVKKEVDEIAKRVDKRMPKSLPEKRQPGVKLPEHQPARIEQNPISQARIAEKILAKPMQDITDTGVDKAEYAKQQQDIDKSQKQQGIRLVKHALTRVEENPTSQKKIANIISHRSQASHKSKVVMQKNNSSTIRDR